MSSKLFKKCSDDCIREFCDCIIRVANGEIKLESCHLKKLVKHRRQVRNLVKKSTSLKQRRRILQRGGFFGSIFKALLPRIADGAGKLVAYAINKDMEHKRNK
jgi:hypothetical protein